MGSGRWPIAQIARQLFAAPLPVIRHRVKSAAGTVIEHRLIDVGKAVLDAREGRAFQLSATLLPPFLAPVSPFLDPVTHAEKILIFRNPANPNFARVVQISAIARGGNLGRNYPLNIQKHSERTAK